MSRCADCSCICRSREKRSRSTVSSKRLPPDTKRASRSCFCNEVSRGNARVKANIPDNTYVLAFSMMMLHTDAFNRNNKNKMTKADYVRNTGLDGVPASVLEVSFVGRRSLMFRLSTTTSPSRPLFSLRTTPSFKETQAPQKRHPAQLLRLLRPLREPPRPSSPAKSMSTISLSVIVSIFCAFQSNSKYPRPLLSRA